jgi:hypothetical protein
VRALCALFLLRVAINTHALDEQGQQPNQTVRPFPYDWVVDQTEITCKPAYYRRANDDVLVPVEAAKYMDNLTVSGIVLTVVEPKHLAGQVLSFHCDFPEPWNSYYKPDLLYSGAVPTDFIGRLRFMCDTGSLTNRNPGLRKSQAGVAEDYYSRFLRQAGTNYSGALWSGGTGVELDAPLLIDTNNTAPRLTKSKLAELTLRPQLTIAGIRLGMTMEQLVSTWGKPRAVGLYNHGAPILSYEDSIELAQTYARANVLFSPGSNSVIAIWFTFTWIEGEPRLSPNVEECLRVLGEPVARNIVPEPLEPRKEPPKHWYCRMVYKQPPLVLYFGDGQLMGLELNPQAKGVATEGEGSDDYSIGFCLR